MRILTAILLATSLLAAPAFADELKAVRSITVTGEAKQQVVPDEAHLYVNVNAQNPKLAAAKAEHDKKLEALLKLAKKNDVDDKYLKTQQSSVQPQYDYNNGKSTLKGYQVSSRLDITVKKPEKIGEWLEQLAAGQFDDTSVNYTLSEPDKVRDALLAEAIRNAHDKAERMADAAGAKLGRVWQVNEGGVSMPRPMPMMAMMAGGGAAMAKSAVQPPAGEEEVNANVTVTYELKE